MSIFDPLGFVAPTKVKGLIILQSVWRSGIGWDDELPIHIFEVWKEFISELQSAKDVVVPRGLSPSPLSEAEDIQLHVFVDASEEAFAAVVYLRIQTGGSISTPFILGKSKVAPIKQLTIPRLELQAAVMGTRLAKAVKTFYGDVKISKIFYWSDSRTVLCWIRSTNGRFNTFVANRVGEILENTEVSEWRWVPTKENPADAATRSNKLSLDPWLGCSSFLQQPEDEWPVEKTSIVEELEVNFIAERSNQTKLAEVLPDINHFSSRNRLVRATAAVFCAIRKFKMKRNDRGPSITMDELKKARTMWILQSQQLSFEKEMEELKLGNAKKSNRLFKLSPVLDQDGVIVMSSRLKNAYVSTEVQLPPILDPADRYTQLMVEWFHQQGQHYGQERTINELRQHVWIVNCRGAVQRCKSRCLICRKRAAMPIPPEMGQLPAARLLQGKPPFYHCGVDYFGPLLVKVKRSLVKRWGVIFTCLSTRAVHLDLADSLDSSDFLNCLTRFINLRGRPAHIWSDNGTNFVGAEREIREHLQKWKEDKIESNIQVRDIEWHWNPPSAPHMGGSWERLIGDVKKILRNLLKTNEPQQGLLQTLLAEVTGILNSRPITRASPDPDDYSCLTPNHLLNIPCVVGASLTGNYKDQHRFAKSWERAQLLARQFWERWSLEYLPWLAQRKKWLEKTKPLEVGDLVIVLEDHAPRNDWKLGIIIATTLAQDGQVRKVEVKVPRVDPKDPKKVVKYSVLTRPAVKICPLSLEEETGVSGGRMWPTD